MSLTKVSYSMIQGSPLNVLDYGAIGDGATDCTAAFQAAIDAAYANDGGYVEVPLNGTFRVDGTIVLKSGVVFGNVAGFWDTYSTFSAENQPATAKLLKYGTGDCFTIYHGATAATQYAGGGLIGVSVDGSNQTSGGGLVCTAPSVANTFGGPVIRNCIFEKMFAYGIKLPTSTYTMRDVQIMNCEVEGTRSTNTGAFEGSGLLNYVTDTKVINSLFWNNKNCGIENYGGALRLTDVDCFSNNVDGIYDAGQNTRGVAVQCDNNQRYGLKIDVSVTYPAAGRQHRYTSSAFGDNNQSDSANGANVYIGNTVGGVGLSSIGWANCVFGSATTEKVSYQIYCPVLPTGQQWFVGCQFIEYSTKTGTAVSNYLRQTALFYGNSTGTEEYFRMPTVIASGTTQPSVQNSSILETNNATATKIDGLLSGHIGQTVKILFNDTNTTVDFTFTNLKGRATDWTPVVGDSMECTTPDGTTWFCITSS